MATNETARDFEAITSCFRIESEREERAAFSARMAEGRRIAEETAKRRAAAAARK